MKKVALLLLALSAYAGCVIDNPHDLLGGHERYNRAVDDEEGTSTSATDPTPNSTRRADLDAEAAGADPVEPVDASDDATDLPDASTTDAADAAADAADADAADAGIAEVDDAAVAEL